MIDPWTSIDVRAWLSHASDAEEPSSEEEPLGSKEKFWLEDPIGDRWLFKFARESGADRWVSGEDWAEVAASQFAALIGVPTATVRLGHLEDRRGVLSQSVVPRGWTLEHGNELLAAIDEQYQGGRTGENERYSVAAVQECLRDVGPPLGWEGLTAMSAFDVWCGYLVLDAWLAGTDRHDENWGAVLDDTLTRHLAPSFDHGNALGFQERPERHRRMVDHDHALERWVSKGRCRYFAGRPLLVVLAWTALQRSTPAARRWWVERLAAVTPDQIDAVLDRAPERLVSEWTRIFCRKMLMVNRRRLLDGA